MAATDKTYRNQKTLDVIFAVSCVRMLLSAFWMFYEDYAREWKPIQRTFRDVETALNERQMLERLPEPDVVKARQQGRGDGTPGAGRSQGEGRTPTNAKLPAEREQN